MTDLVLVDPPVEIATRFGKLARAGSFLPSLGLSLLAAVARKEGFSVKIIDANVQSVSFSELVRKIIEEKPHWVGFSATTLTIDTVGKLARLVKKRAPEIITIVGGAHLTAVPGQTFKKYSAIDIGAIGEGEETLKETLKCLRDSRDLKGLKTVRGIIFREGKKLVLTAPRPLVKNLDSLPIPAWDLLPGFPKKYTPSANSFLQLPAAHLITSRGCTGNCLFCDRSVFGRLPRMHSAERVLSMIELLIRDHGIKEIQFFDDNFLLFPQRLEQICQGLLKNKWNLTWSCQARADMINPNILKLMKKAGCWQIGLGIESGSEKILKVLKKGETKARICQAVEMVAKAGIEVKGFFILGNPGDTKETLKETQDFILSLPLTYVHTTFFTPYPGSEAYKIATKFGRFKGKFNWSKLGRGTIEAVFIPWGLSQKYLEDFAAGIFKKFYFRPQIIYHQLKKIIFLPRLWLAYLKGLFSVFSFAQRP